MRSLEKPPKMKGRFLVGLSNAHEKESAYFTFVISITLAVLVGVLLLLFSIVSFA